MRLTKERINRKCIFDVPRAILDYSSFMESEYDVLYPWIDNLRTQGKYNEIFVWEIELKSCDP